MFHCQVLPIICTTQPFHVSRIGRKPTIIGFGILSSMFGVFLPFNDYYPMFLFIRLLSAICNEAADLAAYTLCMEITGNSFELRFQSFHETCASKNISLVAHIVLETWHFLKYRDSGMKYRAMVGSMLQAPWALGYALLALIAYLTKSWKTIQVRKWEKW